MVAYYMINILYSFERGSELEYKVHYIRTGNICDRVFCHVSLIVKLILWEAYIRVTNDQG